jgi:proprotein convertase subtilisin/kexin type 5
MLCSSPNTCSQCVNGYSLSSGACVVKNCSAKNCLICQSGSTTKCSTCASGFTVNSNFQCQVSCSAGQVLINGVCSCPLGTYSQTANTCTPCSDYHCISCTINSCNQCCQGYYPSGSACYSCMSNCLTCNDGTSCLRCRPPYVYSNGQCTAIGSGFNGGITDSGSVFTCDPGCSVCARTPTGVMVCLTV